MVRLNQLHYAYSASVLFSLIPTPYSVLPNPLSAQFLRIPGNRPAEYVKPALIPVVTARQKFSNAAVKWAREDILAFSVSLLALIRSLRSLASRLGARRERGKVFCLSSLPRFPSYSLFVCSSIPSYILAYFLRIFQDIFSKKIKNKGGNSSSPKTLVLYESSKISSFLPWPGFGRREFRQDVTFSL